MGVEGQMWHCACRRAGTWPREHMRARNTYLCNTTSLLAHTDTPTHTHMLMLSEIKRTTIEIGLQACAQPSTEAATVEGQIWEWKAKHGTVRADAHKRCHANTREQEKHRWAAPNPYSLLAHTDTHTHTHTHIHKRTHTRACCQKSNAKPQI